jgi:hypothetical protein
MRSLELFALCSSGFQDSPSLESDIIPLSRGDKGLAFPSIAGHGREAYYFLYSRHDGKV